MSQISKEKAPLMLKRLASAVALASIGFFAGVGTATMALVHKASSENELFSFLAIAARTYDILGNHYAAPLDPKEMRKKMLAGLIDKLDPHSEFIPSEAEAEFASHLDGQYGGVGIVTELIDGKIVITDIHPDGPASKSNINVGDSLISVEGVLPEQPTTPVAMSRFLDAVKGKAGEPVRLGFESNKGKHYEVVLTRKAIEMKSAFSTSVPVKGKQDAIYIQLRQFTERSSMEMAEALDLFRQDASSPSAIILDLRDNPGGLLKEAVSISAFFLPPGSTVVSSEERNGEIRVMKTPTDLIKPDSGINISPESLLALQVSKQRAPWLSSIPLYLLVDGGSASAAEIVAAAMKDHGRATLVGQRTYGKGSVQTVISLGDEGTMKVTTSLYKSPSGTLIQAKGVSPDIDLNLPPRFREENIPNHLSITKNIEKAVPFDEQSEKESIEAIRAKQKGRKAFSINADTIKKDIVVLSAIEHLSKENAKNDIVKR